MNKYIEAFNKGGLALVEGNADLVIDSHDNYVLPLPASPGSATTPVIRQP